MYILVIAGVLLISSTHNNIVLIQLSDVLSYFLKRIHPNASNELKKILLKHHHILEPF
jgi:hypothetical protein